MITFADGTAETRVAARYADFDAQEMHRVQLERNARREAARHANALPQVPAPVQNAPVAPAVRVATEGRIAFLVKLSAERYPAVTEASIRAWAQTVDYPVVAAKIDALLAMPKPKLDGYGEVAAQVPAGRYAVTGDNGQTVFLRVDKPTDGRWAGRTFVAVQAGDELHKAYGAPALGLLRKIVADTPEAACIRYGHELGECGRCGRTLTDEASRAAGIGPVCVSKGW